MILEAKQISKSFQNGTRKLEVLRKLSLSVDKGEIVTIMGPSGSGKSTLLNILGTLDSATSGTVVICGKNIVHLGDKSLAELRNRHIGFVFQFHHLLPEFTALENVLIPAELMGAKDSAKSRAKELFEYVGLTNRTDHFPSQLSGGERLRVAVLRALINTPDIILTDEPTGNLDAANAERLLELFTNICRDFQQAMIITTHDQHVASIGSRTCQLEKGTLLVIT